MWGVGFRICASRGFVSGLQCIPPIRSLIELVNVAWKTARTLGTPSVSRGVEKGRFKDCTLFSSFRSLRRIDRIM